MISSTSRTDDFAYEDVEQRVDDQVAVPNAQLEEDKGDEIEAV
jgi:hypothetical protein